MIREAGTTDYANLEAEGLLKRIAFLEGELRDCKAAEARLRQVLELAPIGIVLVNSGGRIISVNSHAEKIFGYGREDLHNEFVEILVPIDLRTQHAGDRSRYIAQGEPRRMGAGRDLQGRRKDGTEFPVEIELTPIQTPEGVIILATVVDISERKQTQQMNARLAAIVESSSDSIIGESLDGTITSWNRGAAITFGYSAEEIVGKPITILLPPDRGEELPELMARIQRGETVEHFETVRKRKDGQRIDISLTISPIRDSAGVLVGVSKISKDITERNRVRAEVLASSQHLQVLIGQLEESNKELEAFTYSVSHDLRSPLRAIDGFSRILLEDFAGHLPEDGRRYLKLARENTQRMGQLIDDLLAFSRLNRQTLTKRSVAPAALLQSVLAELREEHAGRDVEVVVGELPICQADPALLKQVFVNLVGNAFKYTRGRPAARIEIGCQSIGDFGAKAYFVKDNGAGFDLKYADKLFGVFQRLHRAEDYPGTGVGLAIVKRIILRHGGRVWADAAVNEGATFYFTLAEGTNHG